MIDLKEIHWLMWQVLDKSQTRSIDSHSVQPKKKLKVETKNKGELMLFLSIPVLTGRGGQRPNPDRQVYKRCGGLDKGYRRTAQVAGRRK